MEKYSICTKDEMYSFDEIRIIYSVIDSSCEDVKSKFEKMMNTIESKKESMAIFFMPQNSFDVFSLFQTDYSVCQIEQDDIQKAVDYIESSGSKYSSEIKNHISSKLKILCKFLEENKTVNSVAIQSDVFSYIE